MIFRSSQLIKEKDTSAIWRQRTCGQAFTLIELLVVTVIVGILVALAFPAFGNYKTRANTVKCAGNMKAIGQALFAYAAEHGGRTVTAYTESPVVTWPDVLRNEGYLTQAEERNIMACPAYPPYKYSAVGSSILAYGLRRISTPWENRYDPAYTVGRVPKPSNYVLLVDSVAAADKRQFYFLDYPGFPAKGNQIHLRHSKKANILFADGSIRPMGKQDILDLGDGWTENAICETIP